MSVNQKEGVFNAVINVLDESGQEYDPSSKVSLTTEQRRAVTNICVEACMKGDISMTAESRAKHDTAEKQYKYFNGTVGNWLSKDTRLNGGIKHTIKNPGSRAGQGDAMLKSLKGLLAQVEATGTDEQIAKVQAEVDKRKEELAASKAKKVEINADLIPEELKHLLPSA